MLFCFILSTVSAQTQVKVIGQFIGIKPGAFKQVTISSDLIKRREIVCPVSDFGGFTAPLETTESGFCKLSFNSFSLEFIAGAEPVLRIKITMRGDTLVDASFEDSRENAAYQLLQPLLKNQARMYTWFLNCRADSCLTILRQEEKLYHNTQDTIAKIYPGTYAARVLCPLYDIYLADTVKQLQPGIQEMLVKHTSWGLSEVYNNKHLAKLLSLYLDYAQISSGINKQCLTAVMDKTETGSAQRNKLANLMFDDLMRSVDDEGLKSLLELAGNKQAGITDPVLLEKCKRAAIAVTGNKAPEIELYDVNGKPVKLQSTAALHSYTLLVLWSPDCPHCIAAMNMLTEAYKKYRSNGLEIFAVSMGDNRKEWLDAIGNYKSKWINVQTDEKSRAQVEEYFVTFTPALILLNQQGVIIKRRMAPEALNEILASYFK